jgi:endonuclease III
VERSIRCVELSDDEAMDYLLSLPGVGVKTAKCVLMYSLGRAVLPIDIHVLRVAKRLGWCRSTPPGTDVDRQLERRYRTS